MSQIFQPRRYKHDPELLMEEIREANSEIANAPKFQQGVPSSTRKYCY